MKRRLVIFVAAVVFPLFGLLNILGVCFPGTGDIATSLTSGPAVVICLDGGGHALFSSFAPARAKSYPTGVAKLAWSAPLRWFGPQESGHASLVRVARDGHAAAVSIYQLKAVYLI
jgi:hypothetical protein